jgi:hypothetical protein
MIIYIYLYTSHIIPEYIIIHFSLESILSLKALRTFSEQKMPSGRRYTSVGFVRVIPWLDRLPQIVFHHDFTRDFDFLMSKNI